MNQSNAQLFQNYRFDPLASPLLDENQAGHLRRMTNLAARLPDDWSGMQGKTTLQEDFSSLRFQLAYMSYALALTHVHRLPAAPVVFKKSFDQLIQKMLSPDVWTYWHYVSTGNGPHNRSLGELPARWDPVETDNIMYSAYVQSMTLMYHYLFRDPKYAEPGALTFSVNPLFWGLGGKHFQYDERSLNDLLYWKMVERGYLGIACEPNCVFQVCNQPPIIGFRFHDLVYGGSTAKEVTDGYVKAWAEFGMLDKNGHLNMMVLERERQLYSPPNLPWVDFWAASLMHAWNPEFVKKHYPRHMAAWSVPGPDGTLTIKAGDSWAPGAPVLYTARDIGWAAICASEVGDKQTLDRFLGYADRFFHPRYDESGGRYYPRRDAMTDADGWPIAMDPNTGNVLLAYARLNVPDGLRKLYDGPWDDTHFSQPALVAMEPELDVRRAWFEDDQLALTLKPLEGSGPTARLEISNVWNRGHWELIVDDRHVATGDRNSVLSAKIGAVREDDCLVINLPLERITTLSLIWD